MKQATSLIFALFACHVSAWSNPSEIRPSPPKMCLFSSSQNENEPFIDASPQTNDAPSTGSQDKSETANDARQNMSARPATEAPKLSTTDIMRAMGTSPRRILLSTLSASGIALAGNFLGVTSKLLTTFPEDAVEVTGLDTYFPRGQFKRCRANGYTFVIPTEWVADTFVELAKAQRQTQPLDYSMRKARRSSATLPDSAYGPPGRLNVKGVSESGDTNVSVIVSPVPVGFSLQSALGPPQSAAETLLKSIAPEGSGRVATLVDAFEDTTRQSYEFEFVVDRGERGPPLRNLSVIAVSSARDKLFTLTVVAPTQQWENADVERKLRKIASSFHLTK